METLPVMAGLITAVSALILIFSFIVYRRTGLHRILVIAGISGILMIKGILLFMDMAGYLQFTSSFRAALDLIMAVFLLLMLFGKE